MTPVFKVFTRFIFAIYSSLLFVFVLVNLLSFAGINLADNTPFSNISSIHTFDNSYFGFFSLLSAIDDFPNIDLFADLSNFYQAVFLSVQDVLADFNSFEQGQFWVDIVVNFSVIMVDMLIMPIKLVFATFGTFLELIRDFLLMLEWFVMLFVGYYNTPVVTNPSSSYQPTSLYWSTSTYFNG